MPRRQPGKTPAQRMRAVVKILARLYPDASCALVFNNAFEVLIATILSAQTTDASVNAAAPALFGKYPTPEKLAAATPEAVLPLIRTIGLYRNKSKYIVACARALVDRFGGVVPSAMDDLVSLPGAGRKTANCVRVNAFHLPGIMCDTHCCRLSARIGLTDETNPEKVERDLAGLMPEREWGDFSHRIIIHGRRVCHARTPDCDACAIRLHCRYAEAR